MTRVVVAGGGLAGAAAAAGLARNGADVTLVERQAAPVDKICGEFLSTEAQGYLSKLGLDLNSFGAPPISRLRLVRGDRTVETALPFQGVGLSRRRLDEALLLHAGLCGAQVLRGRAIRSLAGEPLGLDIEGEDAIPADILLLATGKHELRGAKREIAVRGDLIGFKMYFRLSAAARSALADHIELFFFTGGYAGFQMIEDGIANLCLLVSRKYFAASGGTWPALLEYLQKESPYLGRQLQGAVPQWQQPLTIYRVPYGFVHRHRPSDPAQLFRLGDQACVIQSFTGDGMAIALHSAALAVRMIGNGADAGTYHKRLAAHVRGQMRSAGLIDWLLKHSLTQPLMFEMASLWPGSLKKAASLTRIPLQVRL